jgi:predicted outer membrane lipoprotein
MIAWIKLGISCACAYGWIRNIMYLFSDSAQMAFGELAIRLLGVVPVFPIGIVAGYIAP